MGLSAHSRSAYFGSAHHGASAASLVLSGAL